MNILKRGDSVEKEKDIEEVVETVEETTEEEKKVVSLETLEEEVNKWKTEYYKVYADMENVKKRMQQEHSNSLKFMLQGFIEELLPVVDNFERSLMIEEPSDEVKNFLKGYEMIHQQLVAVFERQGVTVIEAIGQEFDPNIHQAVMSVELEGVPSNQIVEEMQKGYMLKDRVIRASLVKVNQ